MRVMLVRAPAKHTVESEVPAAVEAENQSYPPLALLALATYLKHHTHHEVCLLDAQLDQLEYDEVRARMEAWKPDVVGVTVYTVGLVDCHRTVALAREISSVKHVVLGGPHINDFPQESVGLAGVDAVRRQEWSSRPRSGTSVTSGSRTSGTSSAKRSGSGPARTGAP